MKSTLVTLIVFSLSMRLMANEPSLASPDSRWEVSWQNSDSGDFTSRLFIAAHGSTKRTLLAKTGRSAGAAWSPDSKTLLVYDNVGSGTSDTIVFRNTVKGWEKIYRTTGGFHIIWRLDEWLPNAVRLRSHSGGSLAEKVPATVLVPFEESKSRHAPDSTKTGYLGIDYVEKDGNILITKVDKRSPAEFYGLKVGDVIICNQQQKPDALISEIRKMKSGDITNFQVRRKGEDSPFHIPLSSGPAAKFPKTIMQAD